VDDLVFDWNLDSPAPKPPYADGSHRDPMITGRSAPPKPPFPAGFGALLPGTLFASLAARPISPA